MPKFNRAAVRPRVHSPIQAEKTPSTVTHEGAPGYLRDVKSELFLTGVANFVGEDVFYESGAQRDDRFVELVRAVAVDDIEWLTSFVGWLRRDAFMRSASLVAAAEGVKARMDAGLNGGGRQLVDAALARADEPGEMVAYWLSRYGRKMPIALKRGLVDAIYRLYSEYALLKYDTRERSVRFGDVIELTQPATHRPAIRGTWRYDLYGHAISRRHNRGDAIPGSLLMVRANQELRRAVAGALETGDDAALVRLLDPEVLSQAGVTWEDTLSLIGPAMDKATLWAALIPTMGLMALARNLRNFDEAGIPDSVAEQVIARFSDPDQVARSRMFPFRWLAAYEQAPSLRWGHALDKALQASLVNLPALPGRTLILVDTSGSMQSTMSGRSTMSAVKAAAVFGVALAAKGEKVDLHGFASGVFRHDVRPGASVIREVNAFVGRVGGVGHGTAIAESIRATYRGHDRVVLISDMQTMGGVVTTAIPATTPLYGFNLGGYRPGAYDAGSPNRVEFGGLTDATFRVIPLLEAGRSATWPWLETPALDRAAVTTP